MFAVTTADEMREALSQGLIPNGPYRCKNCTHYQAYHVQGIYCPGEEIHTVKLPKVPHPPCDCRTTQGKPLFPGQLHDPDCYLSDPEKLKEYQEYLSLS